jgi:hypothetical protein
VRVPSGRRAMSTPLPISDSRSNCVNREAEI